MFIFDPIKGLSCKQSVDSHLLLEAFGSPDTKDELKRKLSLFNKSAHFKVLSAKKILLRYPNGIMDCMSDWQVRQYNQAIKDLEDFEDQVHVDMYEETDKGKLLVPIGYYWLFETYREGYSPLNTKVPLCIPKGVDLRDYQTEALEKMLRYKRSTGVLATGLGKSMIILGLCYSAFKVGKRVCVVVPNVELVGQVLQLLKKFIPGTVSALGGKFKFELGSHVLVTTAQSAIREIDNFDMLVIDEFHHSTASTWLNLLSNCEKAEYVYGLTATPYREDGMDMALYAFCGKVVINKPCRWGIENGWLKPASVYSVVVPVKAARGNHHVALPNETNRQKAYKTLIQSGSVFQELYNRLSKAQSAGRQCLVLFKTVTAGQAFMAYCKDTDLDMRLASSKSKRAIDDFRKGELKILISNDRLLSEGVDIPSCNCLFTLLNNKSRITTTQAVGRVLRKAPGNAIVVDITPLGYGPFMDARMVRMKSYLEITHDINEIRL